jgi:hypothetical protein
MAPTIPTFINPSLRTNGGDDGAAGALASATSAEKKQGSFLLRLGRVKATAGHGQTEPIVLEGDPEDSTEGGHPKKPKTTKAPPVTQEDDGFGDLA